MCNRVTRLDAGLMPRQITPAMRVRAYGRLESPPCMTPPRTGTPNRFAMPLPMQTIRRGESHAIELRFVLFQIEACLLYGADVDAVDEFRNSALHVAVRKGRIAVVKQLLDCGCASDLVDELGNTPRALAKKQVSSIVLPPSLPSLSVVSCQCGFLSPARHGKSQPFSAAFRSPCQARGMRRQGRHDMEAHFREDSRSTSQHLPPLSLPCGRWYSR